MHGIYNYTPETNIVPTLYTVAAILHLQYKYMSHVMQFPTINFFYVQAFRSAYRQDLGTKLSQKPWM